MLYFTINYRVLFTLNKRSNKQKTRQFDDRCGQITVIVCSRGLWPFKEEAQMNASRVMMLALAVVIVGIVFLSLSGHEDNGPTYVHLEKFDMGMYPEDAKPADGYTSQLRMVSFHYDIAEELEPGVVKRSNRIDYIVNQDDVDKIISIKEKDPETGERNLRLHRVRVSKPYFSSPDSTDGVSVLSWQVISVWSVTGG